MIIPAKFYHLEEIYTIEKNSFNKPWSATQIQSDIQSEMDSENWVYIIDDLVVGYIFGRIILDEFHINNIAVHPNYLRCSIGGKLIKHIISRIIAHEIKVVFL